ncbi:unnamed protein product [Onchocerca flexuosa]|uniref:Serine/threonine-protein phosphatase n=1 Tax=Onchocerca flexuosa TaxID=387005 RepID=A0A183I368_9BILA|nr:unnamed protein product [Onchocerca flexuosa]
MSFAVDDLIDRLLSVGLSGGVALTKCVSEQEIVSLLGTIRQILLSQPPFIEIEPPIKVCGGDLHGQYADLLRLYNRCGFPPDANYVFLGDYVDRDKQSLETICLQFCYKMKYPENFFLLRGNHEYAAINRAYGFYDECNRRYSIRLWQMFQDVFNNLPFCCLIAEKIFCMHGGLSPKLTSWDQLMHIERPVDPPNPSIHIDLVRADPDKWVRGWQQNTRGVSYVFGADVVNSFCQEMNIDLIARFHLS